MSRIILAAGAALSGLSVILGAFAAHGLKARLSSDMLAVFQTGVQYQFYHALALLLAGILIRQLPQRLIRISAAFFFAGILFFSGSLYALALTGIKWFGPITPIGGVCFIVGWGVMVTAALKSEK